MAILWLFCNQLVYVFNTAEMNTRQSLRLIAAAAAAANGGKTIHMNGNGSFETEKGEYFVLIKACTFMVCPFMH